MMGDDFNAGALMVNVSVPLTDWWGGSHAIKKQSLEIQKAENERQNNMELLVVKTKQCWNELQEAYKQILISQKSNDLSQENMRMNRNSYQIGIITLSDLLESQSLLQQSMDKYIESYTNYQIKVSSVMSVSSD